MAISRTFKTNDRPVVLFAESEPGIFSHVITTDDSTTCKSSGTSMKVAAVGVDPATIIYSWYGTTYTTEIQPNFLECTASYYSATYPVSYTNASLGDLTVIDEHGSHIGTQNCTNSKCYSSSLRPGCVGVMHASTDDGWIFKGWKVFCKSRSAFEIASSGYDRTYLDGYYVWELDSGASDEEKSGALVLYDISSTYAITIEAVYEEMPKYSVSFDLDGGTGDAPAVEVYVGDEVTIPNYAPTKSGYTFLGWATTQGASIVEYEAGDKFTPDQNVILYAVWEESEEPDEPVTPGGGGGGSTKGFIRRSSTSDYLIFSVATGDLVYN